MTDKTNATRPGHETAWDWIQRAAARTRIMEGDVHVRYELCREGIQLQVVAPNKDGLVLETTKIVSWTELREARIDPLKAREFETLKKMHALVGTVQTTTVSL